ncbi:MAG: DUF6228 family protein [Bdellovibrionia bacterium]
MNAEKQISIISEGAGLLKLGPRKGEYIDVGIERQSLLASTRVYLYDDNRSLLRLFEELAANWRGWEGSKDWSSLEGDVTISCTTDNLGHISFNVELTNNNTEPPWTIRTKLTVDAGILEKILKEARIVLA